jgi:hypothetical protein
MFSTLRQAGKARVCNSNVSWALFGETLSRVESRQQLHLDIERKNSILMQRCSSMGGQTYIAVIRQLRMGHWVGWISVWPLAGTRTAGKKAACSSDLRDVRQVVR